MSPASGRWPWRTSVEMAPSICSSAAGCYQGRTRSPRPRDLDGDGRLDIVATSWGRSTSYHVDTAHPLFLYYGDFSGSQRWDMIEAQYDDRLRGIAPLTPLGRLMTALPAVRLGMRTFAAYANATLPAVLGAQLERARRPEATTLDHQVLLNPGSSRRCRYPRRRSSRRPFTWA